MKQYIGHESQLSGVEEHILLNGRSNGMRIYEIHTASGIDMAVLPDRCCDIARLRFRAVNLSYFSPCGYVSPTYYDSLETNWLKSFTAGFLTTCGLNNVGSPNIDNGDRLPLHGSIGNTPAEHAWWNETEESYIIHGDVSDATIFDRKLYLRREIEINKATAAFSVTDHITNKGDKREPFEILYHMNMGYPLLDEDSIVKIPSISVIPRDEHAAEDITNCLRMEKPQSGYQERCYYHVFEKGVRTVSITQPKIGITLSLSFDSQQLDGFTEWKMMGIRDYALGLECGNCYPDGRDVMRRTGMLKFLEPGEQVTYSVKIAVSVD